MAFSVGDVSRRPFSLATANLITDKILNEETFDSVTVISNKFVSLLVYNQVLKDIPSPSVLLKTKELYDYEFEDDARLFHAKDLFEFQLASTLYQAYTENVASELGARRNAMDSASKNAGEMLKALNLSYNRKRQAAITTELTEIISGAAAVGE